MDQYDSARVIVIGQLLNDVADCVGTISDEIIGVTDCPIAKVGPVSLAGCRGTGSATNVEIRGSSSKRTSSNRITRD